MGLYNKVLRFVQRDVMGVVRVAEGVAAKARKGQHYSHIHGGISPGGLGTSPGGFGTSPGIGASSSVGAGFGSLGLGASLGGVGAGGTDPDATGNPERIEIIANVVWAELARALMDELGSVVFAVGRPDEFRQVRSNLTLTSRLN